MLSPRPLLHWVSIVLSAALALACEGADPLEKIRSLQEIGQYEQTVEPLRDLLAERPEDAEVQYRYGVSLLATGNTSLAIWPLRKAMETPDWLVESALPLAAAFIATGAFDDAIEVCSAVIEQDPDNVNAMLLRADARVRSRRYYEEALEDADQVLALEPDNTLALAPRAVALLALDRPEEAAEALEALEASYRDDALGLHGNAGMCVARATFAKEKGEVALADERFSTCLERFPADPMVVMEAVEFFDAASDRERSDKILQESLAKEPAAFHLRAMLVARLRQQGQADEALELVRAGTEVASPEKAAEAWAMLGSLHVENSDFGDAADALAKARQLDRSGNKTLALSYADVLALAGRYDEALALAESFDIPAQRAMIRGRVALEKGEPREALRHYYEGVQLWPDNPVARYYSAVAAEQIGDFGRAVEDYRYAMRIDPTATDAYLRLARLQVASGRPEMALGALEFKPGGRPKEFEANLLQLEVLARQGRAPSSLSTLLPRFANTERWGEIVAAAARGLRDYAGPEAAAELIVSQQDIDLTNPEHADALAALCDLHVELGRPADCMRRIEAGLRQHPEAAVFHALRGRALAARGDATAEAAFVRALELSATEPTALREMARLRAERGDAAAAASHYRTLVEADEDEIVGALAWAGLLVEQDDLAGAEERYETLLRRHPYSSEAALRLAELRVRREADDGVRTLELARRAVFFGAGDEAEALVARLAPAEAGTDEATSLE